MIPVDDAPGAELTPDRAFVLQLRSDSLLEAGVLKGRIEHVMSGRATVFGSTEEALAFIRLVLADVAAPGDR